MTRDLPDLVTRRIALVGAPNCGKTALFNRLTGGRQKVANYPGVTVERKEGAFVSAHGRTLYRVLDLPGTYSLMPTTLDEAITRDAITGRLRGETPPELIICVLDSTNLRLSLRLTLELRRLGLPMIVALNMSDLAQRRGFTLDRARLARELGVPVVETVAVRPGGDAALLRALETAEFGAPREPFSIPAVTDAELTATQREVRRMLGESGYLEPLRDRALARLDAVIMHPLAGPVLLALLLFLMFQAVFSWAQAPVAWITAGMDAFGQWVQGVMPPGPLRSLRGRRCNRRCRQRAGVPAADPDPVLLHPAARGQRLPATRGIPAGPAHGRHRPVRPLVHSAAVIVLVRHPRHHGYAHHPQPAGSPGDHSAGTDDDLLGAAAGVCAHHRCLHSTPVGRAAEPAGAGAVRALRCRCGGRGAGGAADAPGVQAHRAITRC